jgi:hypothetical protein
MRFEDDVIRLEPVSIENEIEYVLELVAKCPFTRITRAEAREVLMLYPILMWKGYDKATDIPIGVVYLTNMGDKWMLDAYRDDEVVKQLGRADSSYRAGKMVSDYAMTITDKLYTAHAYDNRAATMVCKALGFNGDFIIMRKDR